MGLRLDELVRSWSKLGRLVSLTSLPHHDGANAQNSPLFHKRPSKLLDRGVEDAQGVQPSLALWIRGRWSSSPGEASVTTRGVLSTVVSKPIYELRQRLLEVDHSYLGMFLIFMGKSCIPNFVSQYFLRVLFCISHA